MSMLRLVLSLTLFAVSGPASAGIFEGNPPTQPHGRCVFGRCAPTPPVARPGAPQPPSTQVDKGKNWRLSR